MKLNEALKTKEMDVRLRDKLLTEGKISKEEVEKYLNALPDDSSNMEVVGGPRKSEGSED